MRCIALLRYCTVAVLLVGAAACGVSPAASSAPGAERGAARAPVPPSSPSVPLSCPTEPAAAMPPPRDAEERALLRVVSKQAPLGASYVPDDLVALPAEAGSPGLGGLQLTRATAIALLAMQAAGRASGVDVRVQSAYRSYEMQQQIHAALAARIGEAEASRRRRRGGAHRRGTASINSAPRST